MMDVSFDEEEFFKSTQFTLNDVQHQQQQQQTMDDDEEDLNCMPPPPIPSKKNSLPLPPPPPPRVRATTKVTSTSTRSKSHSNKTLLPTVTSTSRVLGRKRHPAGNMTTTTTTNITTSIAANHNAINAALAAAVNEAIGEMTLAAPMQHESPETPIKGTFTYFPFDETVDLDHIAPSTSEEGGLFATIFGLKQDLGVPSLMPKINHIMGGVNLSKERIVALRASQPNNMFSPIDKDPHVVVLTHSKYLELLDYMEKEWPRVKSKLLSDYVNMMKGDGHYPLGERGQVYVRGKGNSIHTYVLSKTARGEELRLQTYCFNTKTTPTLLVSLGYDTLNLGNITVTPGPLLSLAKDYQLLKDSLAKTATGQTLLYHQHQQQQQQQQQQYHHQHQQ